jgi:hypothetical protein
MAPNPSVPMPSKPRSADRSPLLKPLASLSAERRIPPVDPVSLANAMDQIDNLRLVKTPAGSTAPSAAASPDASGSNSPVQPGKLQLEGVEKVLQQSLAQAPRQQMGAQTQVPTSIPMPESKDVSATSAPATPHFGAQTEL